MSAVENDEHTDDEIAEQMTPEEGDVVVDPETGEIIEPADEPDPDEEGADARAARTGDVEKASKQLENEAGRHARRVEEIMSLDFGALVPCELCWNLAPGFRWDRD